MKRARERHGGRAPSTLWGPFARGWSTAFAGLYFYWALGGDVGLDVAAGPSAPQRLLPFVTAGL